MSHPIPNAALDDRLAFVGTAGSGKTYNAGSGVERLLSSGARVVIPDPLGVWWGLALRSDGVTPSVFRDKGKLVIFGGPRGDLPLTEHAGALIGETAATMAESCILDLSEIGTKAGERSFMLAFLTALYRHKPKAPLHVIFDEADMWAPQKIMDRDGPAPKLYGMMETIVRRGRIKGFIPWLITQRPAVLAKDVLSQIDGLVSFKLTSSQDRDAIGNWVEGQADKKQWQEIWGQLPTMERGTGLVWLPARGVLKTAAFPQKVTFDSSRTPVRGERAVRAGSLKPVNLDKLKDKLLKVEEEAKASDPRKLRGEITALKAEKVKLETALNDAHEDAKNANPDVLQAAEKQGFERGVKATLDEAQKVVKEAQLAFFKQLREVLAPIDAFLSNAEQVARALPDLKDAVKYAAVPPSMSTVAPRTLCRPVPATLKAVRVVPPDSNGAATSLPRAERKVMTALAQYPDGRTKAQVAVLAGYAVNGGGFNNAISALRTKGFLSGSGDNLVATPNGVSALGPFDPLPTGDALLHHWLGQLGKAERSALEVLARAYPGRLSKAAVAKAAGYEPNGGGFNNALSRLRTLELMTGRGDDLAASDNLFG